MASNSRKNVFLLRSPVDMPPEQAWELFTRHSTHVRLQPPWIPCHHESFHRSAFEGAQSLSHEKGDPILKGRWLKRIESMRKGYLIVEKAIKSPMREWSHWRQFLPGEETYACVIEDRIEYRPPFFHLPRFHKRVERQLLDRFRYQYRTLQDDLAVVQRWNPRPRRILIAGGTGLIGSALRSYLQTWGHQVSILSRTSSPAHLPWDPVNGILPVSSLEAHDIIINLAGTSIARRWTRKTRAQIRDSRLKATHLLAREIARLKYPPELFIQISGIGYYGTQTITHADENAGKGDGFLADLCEEWEQAARNAIPFVERFVCLRPGVVLSPLGGALAKMLPLFRTGLGGPIGEGSQLMSWISLDDLLRSFTFIIGNAGVSGTLNATAPEPTTNSAFTHALASALSRPAIVKAPARAMKLAYGAMASETLLASQSVVPTRLLEKGFVFAHPDIKSAIQALLPENTKV